MENNFSDRQRGAGTVLRPLQLTSHSGRFYPKKKHGTVSRTRTMHYLPHPDHPQILSGIIRKISGQAQEWNDPFSLGLPGTHFSY